MFWKNMLRVAILVPTLWTAGLMIFGCAEKQERTRDTDREVLKRMLAQFEESTNRHKPGGFDKYIGLSFDATAFIDTIWVHSDADRVIFNPIRFRIWTDEARIVLDVKYSRNDSLVGHRYFGLDAIYEKEKWEIIAFDDAGTELNESIPINRK